MGVQQQRINKVTLAQYDHNIARSLVFAPKGVLALYWTTANGFFHNLLNTTWVTDSNERVHLYNSNNNTISQNDTTWVTDSNERVHLYNSNNNTISQNDFFYFL